MKKIFLKITLMSSLIFLLFISCSDNEDTMISPENIIEENINVNYLQKEKKFHVYLVNWDAWGRTSKNCDGFGLCDFDDCWFCCTLNDVVVPCDDDKAKHTSINAGEIIIYDDTKTGYLTIKLDPTKTEDLDAIKNKKILYIDNDISSEKITLHKGEYLYSSNVGKFGGYIVNASKI